MLIAPVKRVAGIKAALQPGLIAGRSIFSLLDEQPEPEAGTVAIEHARGELRFEQVSFCTALGGGLNRALNRVLKHAQRYRTLCFGTSI